MAGGASFWDFDLHSGAQGCGWRGCLAAAALLFPLVPTPLKAQQTPIAIIAPGEAAVSGFSGAPAPAQIAPGEDPAALTFIDTSGPSLRVIDLRHMGGPSAGQLVGAPKPFTVPASEIGQVFAVTLDDASPPNIYVAASSSYGLPIVAPSSDGRMLHVRRGAPNAAFMQGLWGRRGGPGSIWKIDGASARVSLFADVTTGNRPNSGAGLGGLAFDPRSKSLYVADRETGLIHRLGPNGADLGSYDHGVGGRAAQELPTTPWVTQQAIEITSAQFDSGDPTTWNLTSPERRVFGLAVHEGRLFYAVADGLQVWSVGLGPDGAFGEDALIELEVPPAAGPTEISKITFDAQGRMLVAERPAPIGAFDLEALSQSSIGRVLRYALVGKAAGRRVWQEQPDEYALGFPLDLRNGNGGVEIGYNYDRKGDIIVGSCGGFVWMSGEDLRESADPNLAKRLAQSGPLPASGLQGVGAWQDRPRNVPPVDSYFVSYADGPVDAEARGHMGDIAIPRCEGASQASLGTPTTAAATAPPTGATPPAPVAPPLQPPNGPPLIPPKVRHPPPPPPGTCQPNEVRRIPVGTCEPSCPRPDVQIGGRCCPVASLAANAECSNSVCPTGQTPIGSSHFCCDASHVYIGSGGAPACCAGSLVNGQCEPPKPPPCPPGGPVTAQCPCPSGYVKAGASCCLANNVTSTGVCCPPGQAPSPNKDACVPILRIPIGQLCCAAGRIPSASGVCCPPANVTTTGVCCSQPLDPSNRTACPAPIQSVPACAVGYAKMPDGSCCRQSFVSADRRSCLASRQPCGPGEFRNAQGGCERRTPPVVVPQTPAPQPQCPAGEVLTPAGRCAPPIAPACAPGAVRMRNGGCAPLPPPRCPRGQVRAADGACMPIAAPPCPPGATRAPNGVCVPFAHPPCPPGSMRNLRGICVPGPCPRGTIRNRAGLCVPFPGPSTFPPPPGEFGPPRGPGLPGLGIGPGGGLPHQR
ncbi:MAG: hypothetical protein JO137_17925 [Hyphomicrobiales bacterium]|nr:hypothetical protein [Hyphomicrobiales bacterium]